MPAFKRTARAEEDLIEIWLYIAQFDPKAADNLLDKVDRACAQLAENPQLGPARPDLSRGLRYWPVGKLLILYRERGNSNIEVVRVLHGARYLPRLLNPGSA